jgi:hypothetical protein
VDVIPIDYQHIVFGLVCGGFLRSDLAFETALRGIILQQVSEIVRWNNISNSHDLNIPPDHSLLNERAEHKPPDSAKPINCNFHWHNFRLSSISGSKHDQ